MPPMPYLVGITGGSASGKTSFINALRKEFLKDELSILSQDNYYLPAEKHLRDENGHVNYDMPRCIDVDLFWQDVQSLLNNKTVSRKEYYFQLEGNNEKLIVTPPAPVVAVEGMFLFCIEKIFKRLDLKIFIDADNHLKLERRMKRDTGERGVSPAHVVYQWENHVLPAQEKYLLPYKNASDIIINNNEHFLTSLEVLKNHFKQILNKNEL